MTYPPANKGLQESRELVGTRWEFLRSIADQVQPYGYDGTDQTAHEYPPVPARREAKRRNNGYPFIGFHHRNLRIQQIDRRIRARLDARLREMFRH